MAGMCGLHNFELPSCHKFLLYEHVTIAFHMLNLRHLRAVLAIAECGSISAAAAEINLSQPALTQGISRIEKQIGQRLFERRPDGMTTTAAGAALAARVAAAAAHLTQATHAVRKGALRGFARAENLVTMVQVRALIALAGEGSFVSAAHATGLSQPAIHRAIRDVERLCGVILVERRGRGVALTSRGARLARGFRLAAGEIMAAISEMESLSGMDSGQIAIGAMPLARARLLPLAIARFHAAYPTVDFTIAEGSHAELIEPLRDGELDLLIGALRDPPPGTDIVQTPLLTDALAVVARANHPLVHQADISAQDLSGWPWLVARKGTPLRAQWDGIFTSIGLKPPQTRIECGSVMMLRGLMLEGDFLTLLSPDQLSVELDAGLLACVGERLTRSVRTIGITTRANWQPTATQARFVSLLQAIASNIRIPEFE